jgi:hypothetical protein
MKRVLLISLSLVLALVGWSTVGADAQVSNKVVVIPLFSNDAAPVPKTGQIETYATGDDGALRKGVAWPTPRFTDNQNGTVTDNLTGLIWMKNANAFGFLNWANALSAANTLKSGDFDLNDGSQEGEWRLPNLRELQSLVDYGRAIPALSAVNPFTNVYPSLYWSSTTYAGPTGTNDYAWSVDFGDGYVISNGKINNLFPVWCVRGGS